MQKDRIEHEHYNAENPKSKNKDIIITAEITNKKAKKTALLTLKSSSSIFSKEKVDLGTFNLLTYGDFDFPKKEAKILDLGCGYGVIGIALKKFYPDYDVFLSDINNRAIELSKENAKVNCADVTVLQSDLFEKFENGNFEIIVSNPPYIAGKEFLHHLLLKAKENLNPNGFIEIVMMHNKGGKSAMIKMKEIFGNVDVVAKKSGYIILKSYKRF